MGVRAEKLLSVLVLIDTEAGICLVNKALILKLFLNQPNVVALDLHQQRSPKTGVQRRNKEVNVMNNLFSNQKI